jgi:CubicO group peptidase (beta-lactamase class C family)
MKTSISIVLTSLLTFAATQSTIARELSNARDVHNGFRSSAKIELVKGNNEATRKLVEASDALPQQTRAKLNQSFEQFASKALLIAQGEQIIFERYAQTLPTKPTPLGYSMSKSLTALTVGKALCDGHIQSLEDKASKYVPQLANSSWGESSIKDLLLMRSGAYPTNLRYSGHKDEQMQKSLGRAISNGSMRNSFIDLMLNSDEKAIPSGQRFYYNNFDTVALSLVIASSTRESFAAYFSKSIWQEIGAEFDGAWMVNAVGEASTYNGFSAAPRDWLRIGNYVLTELNGEDQCFRDFLKEATKSQIPAMGSSSSYGYQIWTECEPNFDFCFSGFGGQYLFFDVKRNIVFYHHGTDDDPRRFKFLRITLSDISKSLGK